MLVIFLRHVDNTRIVIEQYRATIVISLFFILLVCDKFIHSPVGIVHQVDVLHVSVKNPVQDQYDSLEDKAQPQLAVSPRVVVVPVYLVHGTEPEPEHRDR